MHLTSLRLVGLLSIFKEILLYYEFFVVVVWGLFALLFLKCVYDIYCNPPSKSFLSRAIHKHSQTVCFLYHHRCISRDWLTAPYKCGKEPFGWGTAS